MYMDGNGGYGALSGKVPARGVRILEEGVQSTPGGFPSESATIKERYSGSRTDLAAFAHYGDLEAIEAAIVRAIVRGEQSVATLKETTVRISAHRVYRATGTPGSAFLSVHSSDLAEGLLNLKSDPAALGEWASFILLTSEFFAFGDRHTDYCDRLLAAISDLAFGAPVGVPAIRLAQSIRTRFAKR